MLEIDSSIFFFIFLKHIELLFYVSHLLQLQKYKAANNFSGYKLGLAKIQQFKTDRSWQCSKRG